MYKAIQILQILWQLPQTVAGYATLGAIFLFAPRQRSHIMCKSSEWREYIFCETQSRRVRAVSFGRLILLFGQARNVAASSPIRRHERGHSVQSRRLGPLYLVVVGLPSLIVTSVSPCLARQCWFEKWADKLGNRLS